MIILAGYAFTKTFYTKDKIETKRLDMIRQKSTLSPNRKITMPKLRGTLNIGWPFLLFDTESDQITDVLFIEDFK